MKLTFSPLKMDGWKMSFLLGPGLFSGAFNGCDRSREGHLRSDVVDFTDFLLNYGCLILSLKWDLRKEILLLDAQGFASTWKGTDATCWGRRRRCHD